MVEPRMETVARVEARSEEAFERFFRENYSNHVRALYLLTGDRAEAEDLSQEAFARVFERWPKVSRMDSPTGYLYRTAMNLHRSRLRRLAVRARRLTGGPAPTDATEAAETRHDVIRAVAALPPAQREALVLVEFLGLGAEEAGRALGIEASSVRGRLHRARATLRNQLGGIDG
jgi:RNA polymerase sigma-70 factor (ECF subfamily)